MTRNDASVKEASASTDMPKSDTTADDKSTESTTAAIAAAAPSNDDLVKAAIDLLEKNGYSVRLRTASQRVTAVKAEPADVKTYFDSTGMTRAQIADAVGVTVSVIATVQNPNGDRWSQVRFDAAKILIDAYKIALAARIASATTTESTVTVASTGAAVLDKDGKPVTATV